MLQASRRGRTTPRQRRAFLQAEGRLHGAIANLFVIGASNFPQNASYNPTDTVGALSFWAADAIVKRYLKSPGQLLAT